MIYLMNSAVMPAGNYGTYTYSQANVADLAAVVRGEHGPWMSTIGYPQNADLIESWTGVRPRVARIGTTFTFENGDRALVMRPRMRVAEILWPVLWPDLRSIRNTRLRMRVADPATNGAHVSDDPAAWEFAWVRFSVDTAANPGCTDNM